MDRQFAMLKATRQQVLDLLDACTQDQLFTIPPRFGNHILWNAAHLLATQQVLCYRFTNTPMRLDEAFVRQYGKGTVPASEQDGGLVHFVSRHLLDTVTQNQEDYHQGVFGTYRPIVTSYGITLNTLEDAICYLNLHEGMHFGQMKMLKRLVVA